MPHAAIELRAFFEHASIFKTLAKRGARFCSGLTACGVPNWSKEALRLASSRRRSAVTTRGTSAPRQPPKQKRPVGAPERRPRPAPATKQKRRRAPPALDDGLQPVLLPRLRPHEHRRVSRKVRQVPGHQRPGLPVSGVARRLAVWKSTSASGATSPRRRAGVASMAWSTTR